MGRVVWKEGSVISIRIRDDLCAIAQMIKSPYLIFFDLFNKDDQWGSVDLEAAPILFFRGVTRQFLRYSEISVQKEVRPLAHFTAPEKWLQLDPGSQRVTIWGGEPDEMSIITLGERGVRIIAKDITQPGTPRIDILSPYFKRPEREEIPDYELDVLGVYPETIERLYLCHLFGRNVDPDKELICGMTVPSEYKAYYISISQ
jgi:hypothetical protein